MSGIVLLWHRDGAPVEAKHLTPMMTALAHRGTDGADLLVEGAVGLGHQHLWTTPEEVGERQPLRHPEAGFELAFDGRLDNREWLVHWLDREGRAADRDASDAALVAAAYACWGERCFERFLGPFAIVVHDRRRGRVICARDALGGRELVYHLGPRLLVAASEEAAVLTHPAVSSELDERSVAAFLAVQAPVAEATFFREIRRVEPGRMLVVAPIGDRVTTFRGVAPASVGSRHDDDAVEGFGELLRESVRCRLRSTTPVAVLMSGGMDSTSVAAVAARQSGDRRPPAAVSWVFDELPEADERPYIDAMVDHVGLESIRVRGDDAWPLRSDHEWAANPNHPAEDLYRVLLDRSYGALRRRGGRVLLTGMFGDHLYLGCEHWLRDLLRDGRLADAGAAALRQLAIDRRRGSAGGGLLSRAVARTLGARRRRRGHPPWLTPAACRTAQTQPAVAEGSPRLRVAADRWAPLFATAERVHAAHFGIDLRHPFRDLRMVELTAGLPAHLFYRPGWSKWILRRAMRGLLPEAVRTRRWASSLSPLAARGLADRERGRVRELLDADSAIWPRFVRREWIEPRVPQLMAGRGAESLVPWLCLSLELWRCRLESRSNRTERHAGLGVTSEGMG